MLYIRTDENGLANVDFQLGTDRKQDVTVSAVRQTKTVSAYAGESVSGNQLVEPGSSVVSRALGRAGEYELRVKAEDEDGDALPNAYVEFRTSDGDLEDPGAAESSSLGRLGVRTGTRGVAFVFFDPKDGSGSPRVTAHLLDLGNFDVVGGTDDEADTVIDDVVSFDISGTVTRQPTPGSNIAGAEVDDHCDSCNKRRYGADGYCQRYQRSGDTCYRYTGCTGQPWFHFVRRLVTTGTATEITLPSTPGDYTILATDPAGIYTTGTASVTVTVPAAPGTLSITAIGTPTNLQQTVEVSAANAAGTGVRGCIRDADWFLFYNSDSNNALYGFRQGVIVAIPTAVGSHTLTASATGYTSGSVALTATGQTTPTTTTTTTTTTRGPAGEADSVEIDGSRQLSGTVDQAMRLRVRVLDANDNGVSDVRVTFRVLSPGRGTFAGAREWTCGRRPDGSKRLRKCQLHAVR